MRTAAKIDLTNGMVTLDDGSKKTIDNYILELEDRFIELQEVLLKQNQEIDQLKAREEEHQILNGELREENEKSNNIIKRLEKYVIDRQIGEYGDTLEEAEQYLQELKGSNSNEQQ